MWHLEYQRGVVGSELDSDRDVKIFVSFFGGFMNLPVVSEL
mgnify:CR=1 FL=1